ncbi:radical SAM protein [Candidatus Woesearchaeota archaeon]|nr:radical SAM protein [Candidatus Woesearchaeota archaeon]
MKTLLLFPPQINPIHPHLALPLLNSFLKENNYEVEILDTNILAYDYLLTKKHLKKCYDKIKLLKNKDKFQELALLMADYLIENVENSKEQLRNPEIIKDFNNYSKHVRLIKFALNLISCAFPGELISLTQYQSKYNTNTPENILKNIDEENIFTEFNNNIIKDILEKKPDIVGFSIVLMDQLVPALDLAKKIKENNPNIKIVLGGTTITRLIDNIKNNPLYFKYVDFYIKKEGEIAMLELITSLKNNTSLENVPNLVYFHNKIIENKQLSKQILIKDLPFPNFDGFDFNLYLSPNKIIPTIFSRNCYWNKCSFCDICHGYDNAYRIKGIKKLIQEIAHLKNKYHVNYFRFVDEAIHPIHLKEFSNELIKLNLNIKWETACRVEKEFKNPDFCNLLYKSGCRSLSFGVESGSQKVIDLMNKGYDLKDVDKILNSVNNAGISTHIYLMTDFPGESDKEFQETINLMLKNKEFIQSFQVSKFMLTKKSILSKEYSKQKSDPGSSSLNFEINNNTDRPKSLKQTLKENLPHHKVGQELISSHRMIFTDMNSNRFCEY